MVDALATVQQALVQHDSGLRRAFVATCTAHITLGVMHLPSGDHVQDCCDALAALAAEVPAGLLSPFQLALAGLSHFNNKVLYLDIVPDDGADTLQRLAQHVQQHMGSNGIEFDQGRGAFTPHVTVAKLSALNGNARRSIRSIPQEAYAEHSGIWGGSVGVHTVQLCAMAGRQRDCYYRTEAAFPLAQRLGRNVSADETVAAAWRWHSAAAASGAPAAAATAEPVVLDLTGQDAVETVALNDGRAADGGVRPV